MAELQLRIQLEAGTVSVDQARWEAFANDPSGPIVQDLVRRGNNVEAAARADAPVATGTLAATIRTQPDFGGRLPAVDVIAGREGVTGYTGYVIYGTAPHVITPSARKALRFIGSNGVVFASRVNHPGTKANGFLERALAAAAD